MKIMHTSDWHVGRTFHGASTLENLSIVLDALIDLVRKLDIDVVVVSGDVYDSSTPAADFVKTLDDVIRRTVEAGAKVFITSGNHDSAQRLGFNAGAAALGGVHMRTRAEESWEPVIIASSRNADDRVAFYGVPYLEPRLVNGLDTGERFTSHESVLTYVMGRINESRLEHQLPSVVAAHCFAAAGSKAATDTTDTDGEVSQHEGGADITAGGLGIVPVDVFAGPEYVALGHIHGRHTLSESTRYSGAPLHYSFSEIGKPRGVWIVDLHEGERKSVEWIDLPVPRPLAAIEGELQELISSDKFNQLESAWVKAILTDQVVPVDPMAKLRQRFPHIAVLEKKPKGGAEKQQLSYAAKVKGKSDVQLIEAFLAHVRNGKRPDAKETKEILDVLAEVRAGGTQK